MACALFSDHHGWAEEPEPGRSDGPPRQTQGGYADVESQIGADGVRGGDSWFGYGDIHWRMDWSTQQDRVPALVGALVVAPLRR